MTETRQIPIESFYEAIKHPSFNDKMTSYIILNENRTMPTPYQTISCYSDPLELVRLAAQAVDMAVVAYMNAYNCTAEEARAVVMGEAVGARIYNRNMRGKG